MGQTHSFDSRSVGGLCGSCGSAGMMGGCGCTVGGSGSSYSRVVETVNVPGLGSDFVNQIAKILGSTLPVDQDAARKQLVSLLNKRIKSSEKIQTQLYNKIRDYVGSKLQIELPENPEEGLPVLSNIITNLNDTVSSTFEKFKVDVSGISAELNSAMEALDKIESDPDFDPVVELLRTEIVNRKSAIDAIGNNSLSGWSREVNFDAKLGTKDYSKLISGVLSSAADMNDSLLKTSSVLKDIKVEIEKSDTGSLKKAEELASKISGKDFIKEKINSVINILSKIDYAGLNIMATGGSKREDNLSLADVDAAHGVKGSKSAEEQFRRVKEAEQEDDYFESDFYNAVSKLLLSGEGIAKKIGKGSIGSDATLRGVIQRFESLKSSDRARVYTALCKANNKDDHRIRSDFVSNLESFSAFIAKSGESSKYSAFKNDLDNLAKLCRGYITGGSYEPTTHTGMPDGPQSSLGFSSYADFNAPGAAGGKHHRRGGEASFGTDVAGGEAAFGTDVAGGEQAFGTDVAGGESIMHVPTTSVIQGIYSAEVLGGEEREVYDGGNFVYVGGVTKRKNAPVKLRMQTAETVATEMKHNYKTAQILEAMQSGQIKDLESYGEEYKSINADEIAYMIDRAQVELNNCLKDLHSTEPGSLGAQLAAYASENKIPEVKVAGIRSAYEFLKKEQFEVKAKFLRAVESVDLYLRDNTLTVMKDPEALKPISALLSDLESVPKWFNEKSGDEMANVFESFPSKLEGTKPYWTSTKSTDAPTQTDVTVDHKHYYEWVAKQSELRLMPGNPNIGFVPNSTEQIAGLKKTIKNAVVKVRVLENILNLVDKIGSKKMSSVSALGPLEVYRAITDYIVMSSITVGFNEELLESIKASSGSFWNDVAVTLGSNKVLGPLIVLTLGLGGWWLRASGKTIPETKIGFIDSAVGKAKEYIGKLTPPKILGDLDEFGKAHVNQLKYAALGSLALTIISGILRFISDSDLNPDEVGIIQNPEFAKLKAKIAKVDTRMEPGFLPPELLNSVLKMAIPAAAKMGGNANISNIVSMMSSSGVDVSSLLSSLGSGDLSGVPVETLAKLADNMDSPAVAALLSFAIQNLAKTNPEIAKVIQEAGIDKLIAMSTSTGATGGADVGFGTDVAGGADVGFGTDVAGGEAAFGTDVAGGRRKRRGGGDLLPDEGVYGGSTRRTGMSYGGVVDSFQIMLASIPVGQFVFQKQNLLLNGGFNDFTDTDHLFEMLIKSLIAKVLVHVGVHDLFHKSYSESTRPYAPVRLMLGAGSISGGGDDVKVINEAIGLYVQLPLVAEFYREFFKEIPGDEMFIGIAPEFSKMWNDFVRLIFVDTKHLSQGVYNDSDVRLIIAEVNKLYHHFNVKGNPEETARKVINAFVREMNQRYGFLRRSDVEKFEKQLREVHPLKFDETGVEYGETLDSKKGDVGSDALRVTKQLETSHTSADKPFSGNRLKLWSSFSRFIERYVNMEYSYRKGIEAGEIDPFFIKNSIEAYKNQLKHAKDERAKFNMVRDMVQGSGKLMHGSYENLILFVELVVTPLEFLNAITQILQRFCAFVHGTSFELLQKFLDTIDGSKAGSMNNKDFTGTPNDSFGQAFYSFLSSQFPAVGDMSAKLMMIANQLNPYLISDVYTVQNGINGATSKYTAGKCRKQSNWNAVNKEAWLRFGVDRQSLFRDYVENLFSVGIDTNKLVDISYSSGRPIVNYSNLQDLCTRMFNGVRANLNKFRGSVLPEIVANFEHGGLGSIEWVENRLIKALFNSSERLGLSEVNNSLKVTFDSFRKTWNFDASNPRDPKGSPTKDSFDDALSGLIYWNYKTNSKSDIRGNMAKTDFPDFYIPTFKSGSFEPQTIEEKELNAIMMSSSGFVRREILDVQLNKLRTDFARVASLGNVGATLTSAITSMISSGPNQASLMLGFPFLPLAYLLARTGELNGTFVFKNAAGDEPGKYIENAINTFLENERKDGRREAKAAAGPGLNFVETVRSLLLGARLIKVPGRGEELPEIGRMTDDEKKVYEKNAENLLFILGANLVNFISVLPVPDFLSDNKFALETFNIYKRLAAANRIPNKLAEQVDDADKKTGQLRRTDPSGRQQAFTAIGDSIDKIYSDYYNEVYKLVSKQEENKAIDERLGDNLLLRNRLAMYGSGAWESVGKQSLMIMYNEVISRLITYCADGTPGGRVYTKLFSEIAKSAHSAEIGPGASGVKDINFGAEYLKSLNSGNAIRFDPQNSVLFASLAKAIQTIMKPASIGRSSFGFQEIGEVSPSLIPIMQANLPAFEKLLEMIALKANFLSSIVNSDLNFERVLDPDFAKSAGDKFKAELTPATGIHGGLRQVASESSSSRKTYYVTLLNQLLNGARGLESSISESLGVLGGSGLYLETSSGFIKNFTSVNKQIPLMPLSSMTYLLNRSLPRYDLLPMMSGANNAKFKLLYGFRHVMNKYNEAPRLEHMPGVKNLLEKYSDAGLSITTESASKMASDVAIGIRYVTDITDFKRILGGELGSRSIDMTFSLPPLVQTYQYAAPDIKVVELTESPDINESIIRIISDLNPSISPADRSALQIMNIINLNIVPINIHQMMREVPLVQLVNYSFTFDRMMEDELTRTTGQIAVREYVPAKTLSAMKMKMMCFPLGQQSDNEYYSLVSQVMTERLDGVVGSKYSASELWNKVLLNALFPRGGSPDYFLSPATDTALMLDKWRGKNKGKFGPFAPQNQSDVLTFVEAKDREYNVRSIKVNNARELAKLGRVRYDTKLVRIMNWLVMLHQLLLRKVVERTADTSAYQSGREGLFQALSGPL